MWASSLLDINKNQNGNDETRNEVNFEDSDFPAIRSNYDRRVQAHHLVTGHNAPHNRVPVYLTIWIQDQIDPLSRRFNQLQKMATNISTDNTWPMVEKRPLRQNSDSHNRIITPAEPISSIASSQQPQTSSPLFKPTSTNTWFFHCKKKEIWSVWWRFSNDA